MTAVPSGTATIEQDGTTVCAVTLKADGSFNGSGSCTYSYTGSEPFTFVYSGDQYYDGFTYQYTTNTYVYD